MPKIACPGCQKQYNLPANAAGQVATCKACGKKFRLGPSKAQANPVPKSSAPAVKKARQAAPVAAASEASDPFWDDKLPEKSHPGLSTPEKPSSAADPSKSGVSQSAASTSSAAESKPAKKKKKKKKKKGGVKWGFDWGKVGVGLVMFLGGGAVTVGLVLSTGYLYYAPAGVTIVGLFTALSGLMGEEGIW